MLERVLELAGDGTWLLLENTAGAGGTIGRTVDELAAIIETCRVLRPTWSQPADRETLRAAARSKLAQRTFQ